MPVFWLPIPCGVAASYRTEKAVSFITEINIAQNIRIGYSYDLWLNELKVYNKGSHEIRTCYGFNVFKRLLTERYFKNMNYGYKSDTTQNNG